MAAHPDHAPPAELPAAPVTGRPAGPPAAELSGPRLPGWFVHLMVGLSLITITAGRAALGWPVVDLDAPTVGVATLSAAALLARRRAPLPALGLAVAAGMLAMPVDLAGSLAGVLVGATVSGTGVVGLARHRSGRLSHRRAGRAATWGLLAVLAVLLVPVDLKEPAAVAGLLAAYAVAVTTGRTTALVSTGAAAGALAAAPTLLTADAWTGPDTPVPLVAAVLVGAAAGDAVRSRRELAVAWRQRARLAVEEESRRRVVEERLRIAREVHDLVAHHIAVISVQSGVAAHHLPQHPQPAAAALEHVRTASRTVLDELGGLLNVLRAPDEGAPVEPAAGLADLPRLVGSFAATGLRVESAVSGTPRQLPAFADLSAYRVLQEALTNAHRHGDGRARMLLDYRAEWLHIEVDNGLPPDAPAGAGTGHGLVGIRERVRAAGGTVRAGVAGDRFTVHIQLPIGEDGGDTAGGGAQ